MPVKCRTLDAHMTVHYSLVEHPAKWMRVITVIDLHVFQSFGLRREMRILFTYHYDTSHRIGSGQENLIFIWPI